MNYGNPSVTDNWVGPLDNPLIQRKPTVSGITHTPQPSRIMGCKKGLVSFIIQMLIRISTNQLECRRKVAMDTYREVLQIIAHAPHPIGWHGIELRLGMKGVVLN